MTQTLETATKENIVIEERPSFELIEAEIEEALAQSVINHMNNMEELFDVDVPSGILIDFSDLVF